MKLNVMFSESKQSFVPEFGEVHNISDGGYERGYGEGYEAGNAEGYKKGHSSGVIEGYQDGYNNGLAARTYETWTITLVDGTVVEKDVALL